MRSLDVSPLVSDQRGTRALAKALWEIGEEYRATDRVAKHVQFRNWASQLFDSSLERYQSEPFENISDTTPDYIQAAHEEIERHIENVRDPVLKRALMQEAANIQQQARRQAAAIYGHKRQEHYQNVALEDKRRLEYATINAAPDELNRTWPEAVETQVAEYLGARKSELDTGIWTAEQYNANVRSYFKNVAVGLIDKDPGRAAVFLETYKDFFDPAIYHSLKQHIDAAKGERNVLDAYAKLYREHGGDAYKMREQLLNPDQMAELGLDAKQVREVEALISDQEKTKRATYEQTETEYFKLLQTGQLKRGRILQDLDAGRIDARGAEHWIRAITTTDGGDDPQAVIIMHDNIARGSIWDKGQIRPLTALDILRAPGISMKTKTSLLDKYYSRTDKVTNEAEKQAKDYLKSQIVSTGPLGSPIPTEYDRLYKAYEALDHYADQARKAGKPWTLPDYMDYARQLANHYRPTLQTKIEDYQRLYMEPEALPDLQQTANAPAKPAIEKRMPGETIDDYLKRTGRQ